MGGSEMGRGHPTLVAGGGLAGDFRPKAEAGWTVLGPLCCAPEPPEGEAPSRPVDQCPQGAS